MTNNSKTIVILLGMIFVVGGCQTPQARPLHPLVKMETNLGNITLELNAEKAPLTVINFVKYVRAGFYDGTIFHRVVPNALIQGGAYTPDMSEKTDGLRDGIGPEANNALSNIRGTVAMVRAAVYAKSTRAEFFLNVRTNDSFDAATTQGTTAYTVFGKVVEGMTTVDRIGRTPVDIHAKYAAGRLPHVPVEPVIIQDIRLLTPFDVNDALAAGKAAKAEAARIAKQEEDAKYRAFHDRIEKLEKAHGKLQETESGLQYIDIRVGTGPMPTRDDSVVIHCLVTLTDESTVQDTTEGDPIDSAIKSMVAGFQEGLMSMHEGGKRFMIVPPGLAYGTKGMSGKVPPDATVVYEVELLEVR